VASYPRTIRRLIAKPAANFVALRTTEMIEEWQPIKTAPKDGTTVLAYFPTREGYFARQDVVPIHWTEWGNGVWENSSSGHKVSDHPTHWMPLPSRPLQDF
jgi:hypothetical protein